MRQHELFFVESETAETPDSPVSKNHFPNIPLELARPLRKEECGQMGMTVRNTFGALCFFHKKSIKRSLLLIIRFLVIECPSKFRLLPVKILLGFN